MFKFIKNFILLPFEEIKRQKFISKNFPLDLNTLKTILKYVWNS